MNFCPGGLLDQKDLNFFNKYGDFCDVVAEAAAVMRPRIDEIVDFARNDLQETVPQGWLNYALTVVENNAWSTSLGRDLQVFNSRNPQAKLSEEDAFELIAKVWTTTHVPCAAPQSRVVEQCTPRS